jgi:hypothetical protein
LELSLRLDTLGMLEVRYLRGRERYRDWPPFLLLAASRQARVLAYLNREAVEELHQQILAVEAAAGLAVDSTDEEEGDENDADDGAEADEVPSKESEGAGGLSPAFAQALEKLNDLARQRLPEGSNNPVSEELSALRDAALSGADDEDEDALEQLQEAFVQMMEVVRELAEELSTDALKLTGRLRCARTEVFFTQADASVEEDEEDDGEDDDEDSENEQLTLALVLRLYEEGHTRPDDLPAVELQLDVDDFERLHETLDVAIERERRSRRRR